MKYLGIRWRLLGSLLIGLMASAVLIGFPIKERITRIVQQSLEDRLRTALILLPSHPPENADSSQIFELVQEIDFGSEPELFILDSSGQVISSSGNSTLQVIQLYRGEIQDAETLGVGISIEELPAEKVHQLSGARKIALANNENGFVYIRAKTARLYQTERTVQTMIWGNAISLALLIGVPAIITGIKGRKQLDAISQTARRLSEGEFNIEIESTAKDEFGEVTHEINHLASRLRETFKSLQEDQAQLNAVLSRLNDGVMILDDDGLIVLANPSAQKIFELDDIASVGKRFNRTIPYHQLIELWQIYQQTGEDQSSLVELNNIGKLVLATVAPLEQVNPKHSLVVIQDLTQLRQLETVRRDFISNISHELRTPLASLKAIAETLQMSALERPDDARRFLDKMDAEIDSLSQLVNELLELSRIESGQVPLELASTDAWQILSRAVDRMKILADKATITLQAENLSGTTMILADPPRLTQVLVNIIHNAIKFTEPEGLIQCKLSTESNQAIFSIQDNGVGIPREDLRRIFERFYKSKRTKKGAGTGLGLAIAKHLVEAHGGTIWAQSQLGEGTTIKISLPVFSIPS